MSERIRIKDVTVLSDDWYLLKKTTFDFRRSNGRWQTLSRETYDRGNGAVVLLVDSRKQTLILTRQFRLPAFVNGLADGMLLEACAGLLDSDDPEETIRREVEEETGFRIDTPRKLFELYMSPGSVTEKLFFFVAEYDFASRISPGGGDNAEGEDIEIVELTFDQAFAMMAEGEILDAKTLILLQRLALMCGKSPADPLPLCASQ
jgi:nudix-type nucleoside diphosphatase (YffH/AdpP family)